MTGRRRGLPAPGGGSGAGWLAVPGRVCGPWPRGSSRSAAVLRRGRALMEAGLKRPAVVIRHDSKSFAEQTEHRSRIHARRIEVAAGLGLEATARRLARNYELAYGRPPVGVPRRAGRVALPAGRPGGRRLPAGRVGRPGGRVPARRRAASRGARGSPGRSRSGDPDLPPEPLAVVARPGRAATRCPCFGLGFPHRRRERREHARLGPRPASGPIGSGWHAAPADAVRWFLTGPRIPGPSLPAEMP